MTRIVFLDAATLPVEIARPSCAHEWQSYPFTPADQVVAALDGATIAITNKIRIDEAVLAQTPSLRYICVAATGYDIIDLEACKRRGIEVSNVPAYGVEGVAEHVIACLFALRRDLRGYDRLASDGSWSSSKIFCVHGAPIFDVAGSTLGIVGAGAIGREVARKAEALGMRVLFSERKGVATPRAGFTAFEEVLAVSDVLTLHSPLNAQTLGLIGAPELRRMKNTATLINTARGALVDIPALAHALDNGIIGSAALDVLPEEPPRADHLLLAKPRANLLLTPHVAFASRASLGKLAAIVAANLDSFLAGHTINRIA